MPVAASILPHEHRHVDRRAFASKAALHLRPDMLSHSQYVSRRGGPQWLQETLFWRVSRWRGRNIIITLHPIFPLVRYQVYRYNRCTFRLIRHAPSPPHRDDTFILACKYVGCRDLLRRNYTECLQTFHMRCSQAVDEHFVFVFTRLFCFFPRKRQCPSKT